MLTEDGLKPILEIEPGDEVIGYVEATGETGSFPVTDTIHHTDPEIVLLTIDDEVLETTAEHPFYTDDGVWVNAADLEVGEQVYSFSGVYGTVESVQVVSISQEMYNLTVDTAHTFFVGEGEWLVHNQTNNNNPRQFGFHDLPDGIGADFTPPEMFVVDSYRAWENMLARDRNIIPRQFADWQGHHGVPQVWSTHNVPNYNLYDDPVIAMVQHPNHAATTTTLNKWYNDIQVKRGWGSDFHWSQISEADIMDVVGKMNAAGQIDDKVWADYIAKHDAYINSLKQQGGC